MALTYVTARGPWYQVSWKGQEDRSGGIALNIGVHFFDLLMWLFGAPEKSEVHLREELAIAGAAVLKNADVRWFLSVDIDDLPFEPEPGKKTTFRSITVDGEEIEFSEGFTDCTRWSYGRTLDGTGFGIADARPSIEYVHRARTITPGGDLPKHPALESRENKA